MNELEVKLAEESKMFVLRKQLLVIGVMLFCATESSCQRLQLSEPNQRKQMIETQLRERGIRDERVLEAMTVIPRHEFVPESLRPHAYEDRPLPIGHDQTISQPYIVALMTQLAEPKASDKALDVGTGSGYQAAVLGEVVDQVYSIEIVESLAEQAQKRMKSLGYENVEVRFGDGYRGWPEQAPFDIIIVAAAAGDVPEALIEQLATDGKLIIPVGGHGRQELFVIEKQSDGTISRRSVAPVAFVPMTGGGSNEK